MDLASAYNDTPGFFEELEQKQNEGAEAIHLGDGAYATKRPGELIITANHHDPNRASDTVYLDARATSTLLKFLKGEIRGNSP